MHDAVCGLRVASTWNGLMNKELLAYKNLHMSVGLRAVLRVCCNGIPLSNDRLCFELYIYIIKYGLTFFLILQLSFHTAGPAPPTLIRYTL